MIVDCRDGGENEVRHQQRWVRVDSMMCPVCWVIGELPERNPAIGAETRLNTSPMCRRVRDPPHGFHGPPSRNLFSAVARVG